MIRDYFVDYSNVLDSIRVGKPKMNPLALSTVPITLYCALGGIDNGFVPWDNSSNLLMYELESADAVRYGDING